MTWPIPYRAERLTELLTAGNRFTVEGLGNIQAETLGLPPKAIRPALLAVPPAGDRERAALDHVRNWISARA